MPLTGGAAALGKACEQAVRLAVEQFNTSRQPGEPALRLVSTDDQAQTARSVAAFRKLVNADKAVAIVGPLTSGGTLAVAPVAELAHVPILSPGASAAAVSSAGRYTFRNEISEAYGATKQADLVWGKLGWRRVHVVGVANDYGASAVAAFVPRFTELGGEIVSKSAFPTATTDFRTVLAPLRQEKADGVFFVFQDAIELRSFLKQRVELGIKLPVCTTPVFADATLRKDLGPLADGVIYSYYGTFDVADQAVQTAAFVRDYKAAYGVEPSYYSALGYDAANLLLLALRNARFDNALLCDRLLAIRGYQGVTGETTFDAHGDVQKPVRLRVVRDGHDVWY